MKDRNCYVVGAGENYGLDFQPATEDFVIAADAGLRCLEKQGISGVYHTGATCDKWDIYPVI